MGKHKYGKHSKFSESNIDISAGIMADYVSQLRDSDSKQVIESMPLLLTNGFACKISGCEYTDTQYGMTELSIACKFMQKYNGSLKKYRRKLTDYEFGGEENRFAKNDKRLLELAENMLEPGDYFCQISNTSYAVLTIDVDNEDKYKFIWSLYIIGNNWKKHKDKYYKMVDEYKSIKRQEKSEQIRYTDGKASQTAIFKPFDQVIFKNKSAVLKYIDNWRNNIPLYYEEYKMVSKLSILLYGEPGTGKSTFAKAVANYLGIDTVTSVTPDYFLPSNPDVNFNRNGYYGGGYSRLSGLKSVYTIDDIDCVCRSREDSDDRDNAAIMSNLLQFLDNPPTFFYKANNGIRYPVSIVIATTNYYNKLDNAIKRYGRFDLKIEMKEFEKEQAQEMCDIYKLRLEDLIPDSDAEGWTISPSYLQALCLENIDKSLKEV